MTYDVAAALVCLIATIVGLGLGHLHVVGGFDVETDFYSVYAVEAANIAAGRAYTYQHNPPGYSLLLAAASTVTGDAFVAGKAISALATGMFGWITYLLLKALFDARIALASATLVLVAVVPFSFVAATDAVGALAVMLPLWILVGRRAHEPQSCLLAGVLAGIAYLVRANLIFLVPGLGLTILLLDSDNSTFRRRLVRVGMLLLGTVVTISPWFVYSWMTYGTPFASTAYLQIAARFYHPGGDVFGIAMTQMAPKFHSITDIVSYDPTFFVRSYLKGVVGNMISLTEQGLKFPAYLLVGSGVLLLARDPSRARLALLMTFSLGFMLLGLVGFYLRYYLFMFPILFLLVAYSLFHRNVETGLGRIANGRISISWLILTILVVARGVESYRTTRDTLAADPTYLLAISQELKERSSPGDAVIAYKPHLAYLAGRLSGGFPLAESAEEFRAYARTVGARYVVYSDYEASIWKGLNSLSDPTTLPDSFQLIYRHEPTNTIIYEVRNTRSQMPEVSDFGH